MRNKKLVVKILAGLLVAGMLIGLLPMFASAAEVDPTDDSGVTTTPGGDLHLNKTAVLQADGTWTITLEAYATGTVKTEVRTQVLPTDIILVLDQSGSMVESKVKMANGTYTVVANRDLPTNEQMIEGGYYFWDANDQKYYPITTTRHIVSENIYWVYSKDYQEHKAGDRAYLESEANGKVATSFRYNNTTVNFDANKGYLLSDYRLYERVQSGMGGNRKYNYKLVLKNGEEVTDDSNVLDDNEASNNANTALRNLADKLPDYQVDQVSAGNKRYAFAYVPVELKNADVYYYTYTYTDDMGQVWTIGHSAEDTGTNMNVADAKYDTKLGNIYTENVGGVTRLVALQRAATSFINDIKSAAVDHKVDHRIAVIGFSGNDGTGNSSNGYRWMNSELFIGSEQYTANPSASDNASDYYAQAFQSVNTDNGYSNLIASIGALDGEGPTYPSVGMNMVSGVASENAMVNGKNVYTSGERKLVVVFMTDGEPGWSGYEATEANKTVTLANSLKETYNAKVYTVALLSQAPTNTNVNNFLKNVSSDGSYALATNGVDLSNFFHSIEISVDNIYSTVELTQNAFLVDRVSEYFNMPAGIDVDADNDGIPEGMKDYVSIYTANHLGSHTFGEWEQVDYEISASADEEQNDDQIHAWVTTSETDGLTHGITVHNFDYLATGNMVTDSADDEPSGKKLIVVIKGVTANDSAALDYYVNTNDEHSGLWDLAENGTYGKLKSFPMPNAKINNRIYVLDYAKKACLASLDTTKKALSLDSAKNQIMDKQNAYTSALKTDDGSDAVAFGNVAIEDDKVYYTPMSTNWYGYDSVYVFWQAGNAYDGDGNLIWSEGDPVTGYAWSKVTIMPANNVYYEDTFVTTSTDGTTDTGVVGIEFGDGWDFTTVGEDAGENTEKPESAGQDDTMGIHGWVESLSDDTGFSGGTVAVGDGKQQATATFTFTGTGVDIYSYTNSEAGTILVKVKPVRVREGYSVPTRYFIVDNYAASADDPETEVAEGYYGIPTVSYVSRGTKLAYTDDQGVTHEAEEALVYGQYEVTITVTTAAEEFGGRVIYYLDGIRVYNPLGSENENNPLVGEGYGNEVHSFFYNIRDYLISQNDFDASSESTGAVFIDQIKEGQSEDTEAGEGVVTETIGTYEDYGPKNEVYLAKGQKIVMKVDIVEGRNFFVGLKSPTGEETSVTISNGNEAAVIEKLSHTAGLYYKVVPTVDANDPTVGYIAIENTGEELLSVCKFQITGLDPNPHDDIEENGNQEAAAVEPEPILPISGDEAVGYATTFSRMMRMSYVGVGNSGETDSDTADQAPESPEIDIENPETPDVPSLEDEVREKIEALVARLFKSVRDWFNC